MMQRSLGTVLIVMTTILLVFAGVARAELLVATDLNTGGTDTGFSGNWAGSVNRFIMEADDLVYANYGITQTGTTQRVFGGNTTHKDRMRSRDLEAAMSGEIWFSLLVNVPADGGFAGISFHSDTAAEAPNTYSHNLADLRVMVTTNALWVDWEGASVNNETWTPDATAGSFSPGTHLILGHMIIGAGNDTLNIWVDPDLRNVTSPGGLPAATYSNTTIDFMESIVRIGVPIWVGGEDTADAIWMSNTETAFYDVTGADMPPKGTLIIIR